MIIFRLKEIAEVHLGFKVDSAVVTVPAYFSDNQRQATRLAGRIAGLDVIRVINEPTAAALAYGLTNHVQGDRNILIYDLGGGTLDVSILNISEDSLYEVKATAGNPRLGGEDFDNRLVEYIVDDIRKTQGRDIKGTRALTRLRFAAEKAKRALTSASEAFVRIESQNDRIDYIGRVTRALFEQLCSDLFKETLISVEQALMDARLLKSDIRDVVLVGGSSRIPKIKKMLTDYFEGRAVKNSINPDEAIASGAAIQAAILSGERNDSIKDLLLIDVVPLSLGVETARGIMFKVINRNTPIPCRQVKEISTLEDYQISMTIEVFEGERSLTKDNHLLGVFELHNIPPVPRGVAKIDLIFDIDANGILKVSARDKSTGNQESITIENSNRLTKQDVNQMISVAEQFKSEDDENKLRLESRNQLETYIYNVKRSFVENLEMIDGEECASMIGECKDAIAWLDDNPDCLKEEYERKMSELLNRWSLRIKKMDHLLHRAKRQKFSRSDFEDQQTTIEEVVEDTSDL
ncbi:heat shock protein 68-like [Vanessa cardui]|uniref:heat shock protein 68-like n=1 Tax=Vanessa cardui TaxID=171605 RepID=UPI001F13F272|nr:heat shock protein 68-like [Vanessa cardui]